MPFQDWILFLPGLTEAQRQEGTPRVPQPPAHLFLNTAALKGRRAALNSFQREPRPASLLLMQILSAFDPCASAGSQSVLSSLVPDEPLGMGEGKEILQGSSPSQCSVLPGQGLASALQGTVRHELISIL